MNEIKDAVPPCAEPHTCAPPPCGDGGDDRPGARTEMVDSALLDEITLLAEVITNVAHYPTHLKGDEVDDVLGVE